MEGDYTQTPARGQTQGLDSEVPNVQCSCLSPEIRPNQETIMPTLRTGFAVPLLLILIATLVSAQKTGPSDAEYIAQALSAAPEAVAKAAAVVRMEKDGKITTLREGKNGFSCMVIGGGEKMCADANSMEFFDAWAKHQPPPNKLGLTYMLSGYDVGGSNTDPYAMSKTADNHWVTTYSEVTTPTMCAAFTSPCQSPGRINSTKRGERDICSSIAPRRTLGHGTLLLSRPATTPVSTLLPRADTLGKTLTNGRHAWERPILPMEPQI